MIDKLIISSPKRNRRLQSGWEGFFPYYAGFPESFAQSILESAELRPDALVLDPWNGSGTTTFSASQLGIPSRGFDLNPVMITVARARLLASSEADSVKPLTARIIRCIRREQKPLSPIDPLCSWFDPETAAVVRAIERSIRRHLVGDLTVTPLTTNFDKMSCMAATFYVALYSVCRALVAPFQSSNPTWLKRPKETEAKIEASRDAIVEQLRATLDAMAEALAGCDRETKRKSERTTPEIMIADTTSADVAEGSVDLILTSPPYCTRIDYTAATRIELAVLAPLLRMSDDDLRRRMIGSALAPAHKISALDHWGPTCRQFLSDLQNHTSKASTGYYLRTHLDYFDKMDKSISRLARSLKSTGVAVFVVQDSYYKDVYNDLPAIIGEMAENNGLALERCEHFQHRSMSGINPFTKQYERTSSAIETVLCLRKI